MFPVWAGPGPRSWSAALVRRVQYLGPAARQAPTSECVVIQARSDQAGGIRFAHAIFTPRKAAGKERFHSGTTASDRTGTPTVDGVEPAGKQILPFVSQRTMTGRAPGVPGPIPLTPVIRSEERRVGREGRTRWS